MQQIDKKINKINTNYRNFVSVVFVVVVSFVSVLFFVFSFLFANFCCAFHLSLFSGKLRIGGLSVCMCVCVCVCVQRGLWSGGSDL